MKILLKDILVEHRGRKDLGDLAGLQESIRRYGVISPILVEKNDGDKPWRLVAGERRYRASILAGLAEIPAQTWETMDDVTKREIEIEENIQRKELMWSELAQMELEIDELKRSEHKNINGFNADKGHREAGWTTQDTATLLQQSAGKTAQDLQLAKAMRDDPQMAVELMKYPKAVAFKKMKHLQEKKRLEKKYETIDKVSQDLSKFMLHGSCVDLISTLGNDSIDCVVTDPPFAVAQIEEAKGTYNELRKDSENSNEEEMKKVYQALVPELHRVMKPGAHMYMFFANEWYPYLVAILKLNEFHVNPCPIIWHKGRSTTPFRGYDYQQCYEPILYIVKEPRTTRQLNKAGVNLVTYPPVDQKTKAHTFHKPPELIDYLIKQSTHPGQTVLDPFAGSGQVVKSALSLQRKAYGFELEHTNYLKALEYIDAV
jgi:DNA modification methylase